MIKNRKPKSFPDLLENALDITREPWSGQGSTLLVFKKADQDRLYVKLARRFLSQQSTVGTFLTRVPCVDDFTFTDGQGKALAFKLTTYPHLLRLQTRIGAFRMALDKNSLAIGFPPGKKSGVTFTINPPLALNGQSRPTTASEPSLRISSTASDLERVVTPHKGTAEINLSVPAGEDHALHLTFSLDDSRPRPEIAPFSTTLARAEKTWDAWFQAAPGIQGKYRHQYYYAWWVLANNLMAPGGSLPYRGVMPSKAKYIGIWNWDACFHALALRHIDPQLAQDQLRIILAHQKENGMLPDVVHQEGVVDWIGHPIPGAVTKPPVMAWTALQLHRIHPDKEFLEEIYPHLSAWHQWWMGGADDRGLAQYHHPYSSGLDDSPLWDHSFPVASPDLNTYLVIQAESLASISRELGDEESRKMWLRRAEELTTRMIDHLYLEKEGIFAARSGESFLPVSTPFNLYPLWTGRLPQEIHLQLVKHLMDVNKFWSPFPLTTVSMADPKFDPETMWRGPVWINNNYLLIQALRRSGETAAAERLTGKTLDLVNANRGIYEYYHPQSGSPPPQAAPAFGWSAALFIDLLLASQEPSLERDR